MGGFNQTNQLYVKQKQIKSILDAQQLLKTSTFKNWCVKVYWGQLPVFGEVMQLGFSGYAITEDVEDACVPDLEGSDGTQVVIGPRSVIIWSAGSEVELDEKIQQTFNQFKWS